MSMLHTHRDLAVNELCYIMLRSIANGKMALVTTGVGNCFGESGIISAMIVRDSMRGSLLQRGGSTILQLVSYG